MVLGWVIPLPSSKVTKSTRDFAKEREDMVTRLIYQGFLKSSLIAQAMRRVPRENFTPTEYRDYAYHELPFPLPGDGRNQTISCPHSYPLFYEALELRRGDRFLEIGTGSGYGAALAREIVGDEGAVTTIEIEPRTYNFAKKNLVALGYHDILSILGDGSEGYAPRVPYDKICVTAACPKVPPPLIRQLCIRGKIAAPIGHPRSPQSLTIIEKRGHSILRSRIIGQVLYVPLFGKYGWPIKESSDSA